ncbi:MAG: phosphate-starvation-inducible PsiE family protein [Thiohalocapsa sp.]
MAAGALGTGIPWWDLPDYGRVAIVLAGLVTIAGLGTFLVRLRQRGTAQDSHAALTDPGERQPSLRHGIATQPMAPAMNNRPAEQEHNGHQELPTQAPDPVLRVLHRIMHLATYVLAIAMVVVILEGVVSVIHTLYLSMTTPPFFIVPDIVKTFGAFLAVLIAYEIFANITLYIRSDVFPVKLVVATAVMAVARKIIVLDMDEYTALDLIGIGAVVLGLGVAYWLISQADMRCGPARSSAVDTPTPGGPHE